LIELKKSTGKEGGKVLAEKREAERKVLTYYLKIYNKNNDELLGRLGDISRKGFLLISDNKLPVEEKYDLKLELPDTFPDADHLEFQAKSVWSKQDVNPDFFAAGFRFTRISPGSKKIIDELVDLLGL